MAGSLSNELQCGNENGIKTPFSTRGAKLENQVFAEFITASDQNSNNYMRIHMFMPIESYKKVEKELILDTTDHTSN